MPNDMVVDRDMNPAYCNTPESCRRWLAFRKQNNPDSIRGFKIRTGWPHRFVTVSEYLRGREGE